MKVFPVIPADTKCINICKQIIQDRRNYATSVHLDSPYLKVLLTQKIERAMTIAPGSGIEEASWNGNVAQLTENHHIKYLTNLLKATSFVPAKEVFDISVPYLKLR